MYPKFPYLTPNNASVQIFYSVGYSGSAAGQDVPVHIPQDKSFACFYLSGGGGGGGGGAVAALGAAAIGGGGGGSGGLSAMAIPIKMLPPVIYFTAGEGGAGGASASSGTAGRVSYLKVRAEDEQTGSTSTIIFANGGGLGNTNGTAGAAGAIAGVANWNNAYRGFGEPVRIAGQIGGAGASGAAGGGVAITPLNSISAYTRGGLAGGGVNASNAGQVGGIYTAVASSLSWVQNISAAAAAGRPGSGGLAFVSDPVPYLCTGGNGGGGNTVASGTGGAGGNGGPGSGGGGGGACNGTSAVAGAGGRGGNGFLIAMYF